MNKMFVAIALILGSTSASFANGEFTAWKSSCADMQSRLQAEGSVKVKHLLGTNTYTADRNSCDFNHHAVPAFEFASDTRTCRVGYICAKNTRGGRDLRTRNTDLQETSTGFQCVARAHYGVFTHPAIWGRAGATAQAATKNANSECFRQMGWNANCRTELCVPAER